MTILVAVLTGALALIPAYDLPSLEGFGSGLGVSVAAANGYFPVTVLGACLLAVLAFELFLIAWRTIVLVYELIPFKAT